VAGMSMRLAISLRRCPTSWTPSSRPVWLMGLTEGTREIVDLLGHPGLGTAQP
jgi:hypothetical protein